MCNLPKNINPDDWKDNYRNDDLSTKNYDYGQWKRTGYPKFDDQAPYAAFFERPNTIGGAILIIPRRRVLPKADQNSENRDIAVRALIGRTDGGGYGTELDTKGRIWWDKE